MRIKVGAIFVWPTGGNAVSGQADDESQYLRIVQLRSNVKLFDTHQCALNVGPLAFCVTS